MSDAHAAARVSSLIKPDLQRVRTALRTLWADAPEAIRPLVRAGALDGGKLLRPSLLLLSGKLFGPLTGDHIRTAVVLELIHTASLLHDDVLDHGFLRRGVPTVNRRWGNRRAVLLGDLVLGKAFELAAGLDRDLRVVLSGMVGRMCAGEMAQTANAGNFALTERQYLRVLSRKTAALFKGACCLGARLAGAGAGACRAIGRFGYSAGMAYQIRDDLLDITGDCRTLCKTLGTDMERAKVTLPLIHSLQVLAGSEREALLRRLEACSLSASELFTIIEETGSANYVQARIDRYLERAATALRDAPPGPVRTALFALTKDYCHATRPFAIERTAAGQF